MQRDDFRSSPAMTAFRDGSGFIPSSAVTFRESGLPPAPPLMPSYPAAPPPLPPPLRPAPGKKPRTAAWQILMAYLAFVGCMIGWAIAHQSPRALLIQGAENGKLADVRVALAKDEDVDATCGCGQTALGLASYGGHLAVASYLIARGANVNHVDDNGDSALTLAADKDHPAVMSLLLVHHAFVNQINDKGDTALWYAVRSHQTGVAGLLLDHGANPNLAGKHGWTMLMQAAKDGNAPLVKMLLAHGAKANLRYKDGTTAYDAAVQANCTYAAWLLRNDGETNRVRPIRPATITAKA